MTPRQDIPVLQVTSLTVGDVCTVTVSGDVDCLTGPGLQEALLDVLDRSRPPVSVEVDLSRVTFLGAVGLRVLAVGHRLAESTGVALRVRCGAVRAVVRPLEVTGLWHMLDVVDRDGPGSDR
ncbi:STAS domain-containing protein [Trujillonella endophytica]|nr:STAS domain-containing protein [Trujillella endophytica]